MANFHVRSKSLPSQSHPTIIDDVEDQSGRLKSSDTASTSASTMCKNLERLGNLHEDINNQILQLPSIQQFLSDENHKKWTCEFLDESLELVDLCGCARDMVCISKESVRELQSSFRRNRRETATTDKINAYETSRKKSKKMAKNYIKKSKGIRQDFELPGEGNELKTIVRMLRETDAFAFSILKSVLKLVSQSKGSSTQGSWSLISKFTRSSRVHSEMERECDNDQDYFFHLQHKHMSKGLKHLKATEMMTQEIEEGLESLFRSLVKTRVSLLNLLN